MARKKKFQNKGRVLTAQEKIRQQILSGERPKKRLAVERRGGRTTSKPFTKEQRDSIGNWFIDPRAFTTAYSKYKAGEDLTADEKIDLGIETGFAGLSAFFPLAQKGKPFMKGLAKKLLGSAPQGSKVKKTKAEKIAAENNDPANQKASTSKPKPKPKPKPTSGKSTPKRVVDIVKTAAGRGTPGARSRVDQTVSKLESKLGLGKPGQRRGVSKRDQEIARNVRNVTSTAAKVGTGVGLGYGAKTLSDSIEKRPNNKIEKRPNNKNVNTTKANKNKAPFVEGYNMDMMDDFDEAQASRKKKSSKVDKVKSKTNTPKDPTEGSAYKYYGDKGTGLGDFARKTGFMYDTRQDTFDLEAGEKKGGRPGRGKQMNKKKNSRGTRTGFSGRGTGAALRGF